MERNFTNENFERFLRQNADGLRMRPSARVWQGISKNLNKSRRRFGFFLAFLLLSVGGTGYFFMEKGFFADKKADTGTFIKEGTTTAKTGLKKSIADKENSSPRLSIASPALPANRTIFSVISNRRQIKSSDNSLIPTDLQEKIADVHQTNASAPETLSVPEKEAGSFQYTVVDSYSEEAAKEENDMVQTAANPSDPMTIESIINAYRRKNKRFGMQFYFTPTISYRHLSDDHIDKVVTHKPYFGFEVGLTSKYAISSNVKLKAGFQFNINRYGIKTNKSTEEFVTFHLNGNNGTDSLTTITGYNNESGYRSDWLQNFYFQASMPVGVEVKLKGDKDIEFGIASTIQPTYVIGDRAYLITNDYKKYAEVPRLIRRWNVNTSLETFVAYSTGRLHWQVGPQVRYQLLSSFDKTYPVKENLFDFGLKVGISLNNQ